MVTYFKNSSFVRSFTTLVIGNIGVQAIGLLFYPFLTRIYSPEEFSFFATFTSMVVIIGVFIGGQYYQGIPLAKTDDDADALITLSRKILLFNSWILLSILGLVYAFYPFNLFYFLVPISVYCYVLFEIGKFGSVRAGDFKLFSLTVNINRLSSHLLKVFVPFLYFHRSILVVSEIVAYLIGLILFRHKISAKHFSREKLIEIAKTYSFLPKYQMLNNFLQILYIEGPTLLFAFIFPRDLVGQYALAQKIFFQPLILVGNSASNVLLNRYSQKIKDQEDITPLTKRFLFFVILSGIVLSLGISFFPFNILEPVFGHKWDDLFILIKILAIATISRLLNGFIIVFNLSTFKSSFLLRMRLFHISLLLIYTYIFRDLKFTTFLVGFMSIDLLVDLSITLLSLRKLISKDQKPNILFLANTNATWVQRDVRILSNFSEVKFHLVNKKIMSTWLPVSKILKSDIIFTWFGSLDYFLIVIMAKLLNKKVVIVVGGYDVASVKDLSYGAFSKNIFSKMLRYLLFIMADLILPVSESNENECLKLIPLLREKIKRINHGFEPYTGPIKPYQERFNQIVTIASVNEESYVRKGVDRFIELARLMPDCKFVLIGSVSSTTKDLYFKDIPGNLFLTGFLTPAEMDNILLDSKIYLQLSRHEAFGASVVEAIQRGCLPIVSDVYSLPWVVKDIGISVDGAELIKIRSLVYESLGVRHNSVEARVVIENRFSLGRREDNLRDVLLGVFRTGQVLNVERLY